MGSQQRLYDPRLKADARRGCMPPEFRKVILPSTLSKWRHEDWTKYVGYDYYQKKDYDIQLIQSELGTVLKELEVAHAKNEVFENIIRIAARSEDFCNTLSSSKAQLIEIIEKNKLQYPVKRFCKLANLSKNTYYEWKQLAKKECSHTKNFVCVKRHPNKISMYEEQKMIELLQDKRYAHYSITSLIWIAKYEALVYAGRTAWDRVKKQNKIVRLLPKKVRKVYEQGLRAEYANQYLHADITYFKLLNRKTYFIYVVKDNFSRLIKACVVDTSIRARTRLETFKKAIADIQMTPDTKVTFVVDSGTENKANIIKSFISENENLDLSLARKDTPFSNSMVERFNFELKYLYLYRDQIRTLPQLRKAVKVAVKDHNYTKRMEVLGGQTPYEVYHGIPSKTEWILEQWKESKARRIQNAKRIVCCINESHCNH